MTRKHVQFLARSAMIEFVADVVSRYAHLHDLGAPSIAFGSALPIVVSVSASVSRISPPQ